MGTGVVVTAGQREATTPRSPSYPLGFLSRIQEELYNIPSDLNNA